MTVAKPTSLKAFNAVIDQLLALRATLDPAQAHQLFAIRAIDSIVALARRHSADAALRTDFYVEMKSMLQ